MPDNATALQIARVLWDLVEKGMATEAQKRELAAFIMYGNSPQRPGVELEATTLTATDVHKLCTRSEEILLPVHKIIWKQGIVPNDGVLSYLYAMANRESGAVMKVMTDFRIHATMLVTELKKRNG